MGAAGFRLLARSAREGRPFLRLRERRGAMPRLGQHPWARPRPSLLMPRLRPSVGCAAPCRRGRLQIEGLSEVMMRVPQARLIELARSAVARRGSSSSFHFGRMLQGWAAGVVLQG